MWNESHPQCIVTSDYESTDLLPSTPTAHAVSSHSFHPLSWGMFIICVSPSDPFKFFFLSQHCWGRWKPTTTPVTPAALQKHCFLVHLFFHLLTVLVVFHFSSCSLAKCYHYRPLIWIDSERSVTNPLSFGEQYPCWRGGRLEESPPITKTIVTSMEILVDIYSCEYETISFRGKPNIGNKA